MPPKCKTFYSNSNKRHFSRRSIYYIYYSVCVCLVEQSADEVSIPTENRIRANSSYVCDNVYVRKQEKYYFQVASWCTPPFKASPCSCHLIPLLPGSVPPRPHSHTSADSCCGWLQLSSSSSISNLSMHNSRFSILLSSCHILIHCPHFLCYSFIFNSISDKNIIYSFSQCSQCFICVCFIQQGALHFCPTTVKAPQDYTVSLMLRSMLSANSFCFKLYSNMKNKSECSAPRPCARPHFSASPFLLVAFQ